MSKQKVILCILDGWGYNPKTQHNAVALADTPTYDALWESVPHTFLRTCGTDVGLPEGQMGNSEVGHMNIGAGRIVLQDLPMIDQAFLKDEIRQKKQFKDFVQKLKKSGGTCHLMGLISDGGVHSHQDHILNLAKLLTAENIPTQIHAFLDGRDTAPRQAKENLKHFITELEATNAKVATLSGRYYAMDRDKRWQRVEKAYHAMSLGSQSDTPQSNDFIKIIADHYKNDITDEFIPPHTHQDYKGMKDGDGLFMANFRSDRVRQMLSAFLLPDFDGFERGRQIQFAAQLGMMSYSAALNPYLPALFPPRELHNVLGKVISDEGGKQLRIAETEKYAHVTFFFNGGNEEAYKGEDRILVPSPQVSTYDLKPEMSAYEVTAKLIEALKSEPYDLVVLNFANPDMVGHTGSEEAAIKAVETIDHCLKDILDMAHQTGHTILITADHGNCEMMVNPKTKQPHTAHTLNKVPLIFYQLPAHFENPIEGRLADIAPTILDIMGIKAPVEMKGQSLFEKQERVQDFG